MMMMMMTEASRPSEVPANGTERNDDDDDDDDPRNRSGNATPVRIVYFRSPEQPGRIPAQSDRVWEEPEFVRG